MKIPHTEQKYLILGLNRVSWLIARQHDCLKESSDVPFFNVQHV